MAPSFKTTRRVEFRDTDAAGIMHFSVFFTVMESVECEFLRSHGLSVVMNDEEGEMAFPRVSARCDYQSPLRFGDEYQVELRVARLGTKSVTYEFIFTLGDRAVATGEMTSVCCTVAEDGTCTSVPIPERITRILRGEIGV